MIRIVTDSAADLTAAELSLPGIFVVPLSVTFADGTTQLDDGTMTKDEFFVRLAEDSKLPRTSQPSPASFMQVYEDAAERCRFRRHHQPGWLHSDLRPRCQRRNQC